MNGRSVWFYDLDHADGFYYPDADGPVITADGAWSYTDAPIGDSGDNHKTYTITLIWADQSCNKILLNLPEIDGDQKFTKVPRGCSIAATVDVSITNP